MLHEKHSMKNCLRLWLQLNRLLRPLLAQLCEFAHSHKAGTFVHIKLLSEAAGRIVALAAKHPEHLSHRTMRAVHAQ